MKGQLLSWAGKLGIWGGKKSTRESVRLDAFPRAATFAAVVVLFGGLIASAVGETNPIIIENQLPGSGGWQIPWGSEGGDVLGEIKGYASAASINKGESITFHVSVNPAQTYTIEVYRLGWYNDAGGRLVQTIGPLNGTQQPAAITDPVTGLIECNWAPAYTLSTTTNWTTGVYLALLKNAQGKQNYISFVVRDDGRVGALLYQQSVTTYQAYNDYPYDNLTGKSLYAFNSFGANTVGGSKAAVKVSFNRPYAGDGDNFVWGRCVLGVEMAFIRWLEKAGYDVTYSTDIDTHVNSARLLTCRGLISPGHDEYWTKEMVDGVYAARDAGVNLGFFSANMIYTQIRLEPSASGTPNRVMVCYRDAALDPNPDPTRKTVNWREAPVNRPEQALVGVQFTSIVRENSAGILASYVVSNASHWVYGGTGITNGSAVTGLVGYEADRLFSEYAQPDAVPGTYTLLSLSPFSGSNNPDVSHSSIYQAASGAWVFAAGTINWSFGLDAYNPGGPSLADVRIQKVTENILGRFLGILETNFSLIVTPPTQTIIPGASTDFQVVISPTGGFADAVSLSVSGAPAGVTAELETNVVASATVLHVTTAPETPLGTYPLTIVGVRGDISHTNTATLVLAIPDFTISASPSNRSVVVGNSTTYTVTINPSGGFAAPVALGVSGLPANTSFSFAPNPATATATLTVTTTSSTPLGSHLLTLSGISGALTRTATVNLSVGTGITVTAPNTAVGWQVATKKSITYTHNLGTGRPIRIEVSRDSGATWSLITNMNTTAASSGSYSWTVSGPPTSQARVKVSSTTNSFVTDMSDVDFAITNPVVTVTSPNTLVSWRVGDTKSITFSHSLGTGQIVNIELSRDGGATWSAVGTMTTTSATSGTYAWVVTAPPTTQGRIRVTWAGDPTVSDISNVDFAILPRTTLTSPNTAVAWTAGTIRNVTWSHNLGVGGLVNIDFSPDNGATWVQLAANVASSAATTGTNAVRMPTNVTAQALIRVSPVADPTLGDVSDVPFSLVAPTVTVTSPNTAVTWTAGGSRNITWSHNLGTAETVRIELARDGVNYAEIIAASAPNAATTTGTFAWVVTGPATATARIRVTWTVNGAVTDISNVNFKIN